MKEQVKERQHRRRGLLIALALHGAVIVACLYPFLSSQAPAVEQYETVVALNFTQHSAAAASAKKRVRNEVIRPSTERKSAPKNPAPPALPEKPTPPILNAPSPLPPVAEIEESLPAEVEPELAPEPTPAPDVAERPTAKPGAPASPTDNSGNSKAAGEVTGSPSPGDGDSVADAGNGEASLGSALDGEGVLMREVIYRPNLDDVIQENGTIALNLCINQRGRVIGVKWNEQKSTITDTDLVRVAIKKTAAYRFKRNMKAPARECGTLTIHVNGL